MSRLRSGEIEIELGAMVPPRSLEDFAITGSQDSAIEDDARFDHVGIRLRKFDE